MRIKKICLIIPSLQAGGMERVMARLAAYLSEKEELQMHLILYGQSKEIFYNLPANIEIHLSNIRYLKKLRCIFTIETILFVRRKIKRIKPDSILSFGEYWNNMVLISVLGLRYPIYISDRSQPGKSLGWLHNNLRHCLYPRAKGLICQTERAKEIFLQRNQHSNIAVIGNPISIPEELIPYGNRDKTVLMVGRLIQTKNQDKLIEMFARVSTQEWKLALVGYDHLKQENMKKLKEIACDLGIEQRVVFLGKQDNVELIYNKSSIFAFTSTSEGFPNAIGEAMAAGLPVVAFDCIAGPSELIQDGYNGFLVPLNDYLQFEERLATLMEDEEKRKVMGKNARESIKLFSDSTICEAFYNFITDNNPK